MSVRLEPSNQLTFTRPFNQMVKEILRIQNPSTHPIIFKVKTTTPKQYCVRPNAGRIEPGEEVEVQVVLQPMREDPPEDFKCKDKFLVQSVAVTADRERIPYAELWHHVETVAKDEIQERRLRCTFLMPPDNVTATIAPNTDPPSSERRPPNSLGSQGAAVPSLAAAASSDEVMINSLQRELREAKDTIRQLRDRNERQRREIAELQKTRRNSASGRTSTIVKRREDDPIFLVQAGTIVAAVSFFLGYWFF